MKSWKTSLGGLLTGLGLFLSSNENPTLKHIGIILASLSALFMGWAARDKDVSSEAQGVEPPLGK